MPRAARLLLALGIAAFATILLNACGSLRQPVANATTPPGGVTAPPTSGTAANSGTVQGQYPNSESQPTFAFVAGGNVINAYAVDPNTGALNRTGSWSSSPIPFALAVHPSQHFLYVANGGDREGDPAAITVFSVAGDGTLTALLNSTITLIDNCLTGQPLAMHPFGRFIYFANACNSGGIESLNIDPNTGLLSQPVLRAANAAWNYPIAIDGAGKFLFTLNATPPPAGSPSPPSLESVAVYGINQSDGSLALVSSTTPSEEFSQNSLVSSGNFLYVSSAPSNGVPGIAAYAVDPQTGALTEVHGSPFATGGVPYVFSYLPSSKLLVAAIAPGDIRVYAIDQNTGALSPVGSPYPVGNSPADQYLEDVSADPTGRFVYAQRQVLFPDSTLGYDMFDVSFDGWTLDRSSSTLTPIPGSPFSWGSFDPTGPDTSGPGRMAFVQPPQ
jgi:6-phosphogluconolactonase (cycloisomerase 2 family)